MLQNVAWTRGHGHVLSVLSGNFWLMGDYCCERVGRFNLFVKIVHP